MNRFTVSSITGPSGHYDCFFAASGAESRSVYLLGNKNIEAREKRAIYYSREVGPHVKANHTRFRRAEFSEVSSNGEKLKATIYSILTGQKCGDPTPKRVCVDISCLTRECLAYWIYGALKAKVARPVEIDFCYSHAKFSPPPETCGLAKSPGPMIPEFAGYFSDPNQQSLLLLGLGYEPHLALSFWELLDPAKVIAFVPGHHDKKYTAAINAQNATFFDYVANERIVNYNVYNALETFAKVESAIASAQNSYRINLAPYGPKIFVIGSLIAAALYYPKVFVWHLNSEVPVIPTPNRIATGRVSGLRLSLVTP